MKVTDYIVEFLINKKVTDIFGYPGGVICHLIDSVTKYSGMICAHINYHEQASAFAACGYAQETGKLGVAFTTSGPGATNLMTGIANAYFDSTPTMFLTGQVDTYGLKGEIPIRQCGFQETNIVAMANSVTKYAVCVENPNDIPYELEKAYVLATQGNPGPVLIDLPADVQRAEISVSECRTFLSDIPLNDNCCKIADYLCKVVSESKRPCFLVGNGVKQSGMKQQLTDLAKTLNIPCVFSMPAFDILAYTEKLNFGFVGANGHRYANFVLGKSDTIISIGSRLDLKQVGANRANFAPQAKIIRLDIDRGNLQYPVHSDEEQFCVDIRQLIPVWNLRAQNAVREEWVNYCTMVKSKLTGYDDEKYTHLLSKFGNELPENCVITADVGKSQVWLAQQLHVKKGQSVHMSAGHGAMGYSLPAAIGSAYSGKKMVFSFNGDGGIQMNIQELQYLARENLPIKVVIINNHSLGMIRGFQEANFAGNYSQTTEGTGYSAPDFEKIADAYGLEYVKISDESEIHKMKSITSRPGIIEIRIQSETHLNPNFGRNGPIQDQQPYLDRQLYNYLMRLEE